MSTHDLPPFDPVVAAEALRPGADRAELRAALRGALSRLDVLKGALAEVSAEALRLRGEIERKAEEIDGWREKSLRLERHALQRTIEKEQAELRLAEREQVLCSAARRLAKAAEYLANTGIGSGEARAAAADMRTALAAQAGRGAAAPQTPNTMRAGDIVRHILSGEEWVVAYQDGEYMAWCGWPFGEARAADCVVVKAATDAEHREWLERIAKTDDKRGRLARAALEK